VDAVELVYEDLTNPDPLRKWFCSHMKNPMESFSNDIMSLISEYVFTGMKTLKVGICDAVITFSEGNTTVQVLEDMDNVRIAKMGLTAQNMIKEGRRRRRRKLCRDPT